MIASAPVTYAAAPAVAAMLALFLWRGGLRGRLFLEALAIGMTLGAAIGMAEAPFDLKTNPLHFAPQTIAFLFAGLPEEGIKMLGVAAFLRAHWLARDRRDVTLAAGALSLGFSTLENIFYLANAHAGWAALAVDRALTATPFHVFEGLAGGFVVASAARGPWGLARTLAAWLAIGGVHGVYDFAVFASAGGAQPPLLFQHVVAALGLDTGLALKTLLAASEATAALLAGAALIALPAAPPSPVRNRRLAAFAGSRGLGWILGGLLFAGGFVALGGAAFAGLALDSGDVFFAVALLAVSPLALGALFLAYPAQARGAPVSPRWRFAFAAIAVAALVAAGAAAIIWGPGQWRTLTALRFEARGVRLASRGDYAHAVEAFGQALAVSPDRVNALSQRAAAYAADERYDAALADVDRALRVAPALVPLYLQRSQIDRQRNDPKASLADLGPALQLKPGDPQLLAMRGQSRLEAGDSAGAYADLAEASRTAPDDPVVRRTFASWDVDAGDFDAGLRDLNAELYADPNDATAAFQRGRLWLYKGDPARALDDLVRADREPTFLYPALWRYLAEARLKRDGAYALEERLSSAGDKWPAPVARMLLGRIDLAAAKAAAGNDGERCEADFYNAARRLASASADETEPVLQTALKECPSSFIEYEGAKAELRRIRR